MNMKNQASAQQSIGKLIACHMPIHTQSYMKASNCMIQVKAMRGSLKSYQPAQLLKANNHPT